MAAPETLTIAEGYLNSRLRFNLRSLNNWFFALGIFTIWAFLVAPFWFNWIADAVGIAVLFYLVFFVWEKRAIKLRCPGCGKLLRANTPWVCGFCQRKNEKVVEFPFVHQCEHCGAEPKAYKCHHCRELIFLTEDHQEQNHAVCLNSEVKPPPVDSQTLRKEEKDKLEHDIYMTEGAVKLEADKLRLEFTKKKTLNEQIEESFTKHHANVMGSVEFARRKRAEYAEEYKNDPEMLKWANESIDDWLKSRT